MTTTKKNLAIFFLASFFFLMVWVGIHLNFNTIIKNDCRMPVSEKVAGFYYKSNEYFTYDSPEEVKNYLWTDRIRLLGVLSKIGTFSWGDVLLFVGYVFYLFMTFYLLIDYGWEYYTQKREIWRRKENAESLGKLPR